MNSNVVKIILVDFGILKDVKPIYVKVDDLYQVLVSLTIFGKKLFRKGFHGVMCLRCFDELAQDKKIKYKHVVELNHEAHNAVLKHFSYLNKSDEEIITFFSMYFLILIK